MSGILSREAILAVTSDPERRTVHVPELKGSVLLKTATAETSFEIIPLTPRERTLRLVLECLINEDGSPVFTNDNVHEFMKLPSKAAETIMSAINEHNGWTVKAQEIRRKNSESQDDDSATPLHDVLA